MVSIHAFHSLNDYFCFTRHSKVRKRCNKAFYFIDLCLKSSGSIGRMSHCCGLVVKALDSHARGCGFKSCLAQDKDYWWGKVAGAHLHIQGVSKVTPDFIQLKSQNRA